MNRVWYCCCALLLALIFSLGQARETAFFQDERFNAGDYGNYPRRTFKTTSLRPPRPNILKPFSDCDDGSYIFVAPRGHAARASFFILDHNLELVWGPSRRYGKVYNFQVQYYRDEPYLFFWGGDDSVGGHGEGKYYMLNSHYQEHQEISAGKGLRGDLHAFFITSTNTAVFTGYERTQADLTSVGRKNDSWIWESWFQEMEIDTGKVIFEWRASEHFPFKNAYVKPNPSTERKPWDFFHINMVDKDKAGNYLVSTRYGRCALYVSKDTGEILWQLGGKNNSFTDLSGGNATTYLGQHDIHWVGEDTITMFDNRADWYNKVDDESIAHRIHVNLKKMTAELSQSFYNPNHILSTSQGNMQTLPNGNALVGYGYNAALTEFSADGEPLCDATFLPLSRMGSGDVQNYRALKFNWTGIPLSVPALVYEEKVLYMSWLGATKVRNWTIEDSDTADVGYEAVHTVAKDGFETEVLLVDSPRMRKYVRIVAVDGDGTHLSTSRPVDLLDPVEIWGKDKGTGRPSSATNPSSAFEPNPNKPSQGKGSDSSSNRPGGSTFYDDSTSDSATSPPNSRPQAQDDTTSTNFTSATTGNLGVIVFGLAACVGVGLMIRLFCWRSTSGRMSHKSSTLLPDGDWRHLLHRFRSMLPGTKRSWQYGELHDAAG